MPTVTDTLAAHGLAVTEIEVAAVLDSILAEVAPESVITLPAAEAAIYDAAGMPADHDAYRAQLADRTARYLALVTSALTVAQAAERIGVSRSRIQQLISSGEVWALRDTKHGRWVLPVIQFDGDHLLTGWTGVAKRLPDSLHPLEILGFLTTPQPELSVDGVPQTVVAWLRGGGATTTVQSLADHLGDIGA